MSSPLVGKERYVTTLITAAKETMELGEEMNMLVSSANILKDNFSEQFGMSFIYIRKSSGPSELP